MAISREVAQLQGQLITVQQQAIALQNDNQKLRDEIRRLNVKLSETVEAGPFTARRACRKSVWW
jgi:hypothetical protein